MGAVARGAEKEVEMEAATAEEMGVVAMEGATVAGMEAVTADPLHRLPAGQDRRAQGARPTGWCERGDGHGCVQPCLSARVSEMRELVRYLATSSRPAAVTRPVKKKAAAARLD